MAEPVVERALIVGASGGIGGAIARRLAASGAEVVPLARSSGGPDLADEAAIAAALGALEPPFDFVFVATGILGGAGNPPEKTLARLEPEALLDQMRINALGPVLVLKHALRLLPRDRRAVFAALSARVGSIGDNRLGGWYTYRAAKAALNQLLHTAAIELARTHRQAIVAALHPGTVATPFTEAYARDKLAPEDAADRLLAVLAGLTPADSGGFFDWRGETVPW